jgi:hypothetical protein
MELANHVADAEWLVYTYGGNSPDKIKSLYRLMSDKYTAGP